MSGVRRARSSYATSLDPIGVSGLGQEGLPVALRLLAAGHAVFGYDRRRPDQAFLRAGGQAYRAPAELADHCLTLLTLLPSAQALMEVTDSSDGLRAVAPSGTADSQSRATRGNM